MFGFLIPPFWFTAVLLVSLFAVSLPFPSLTLMVAPTLRLFFSSLVSFPTPSVFVTPPFRMFSDCVVYLFLCGFHTFVFNKPVVFGVLFCFYLTVICFVRIPLRFFIVWVFNNPFVFCPPFWCCSISCSCYHFFWLPLSIAVFSFSTPFVCRSIWVSLPLPFGFPADVFSPLLQSFFSLEVCLSVFRSLSHRLSLNNRGTKKMMLTCLSKSPINGTSFLFVWHNSSQSG